MVTFLIPEREAISQSELVRASSAGVFMGRFTSCRALQKRRPKPASRRLARMFGGQATASPPTATVAGRASALAMRCGTAVNASSDSDRKTCWASI